MNEIVAMTALSSSTTGLSNTMRRILVIEDDPDLAKIVGRIVRSVDEDLFVDVALTAGEARRLLSQEEYEFVLLDYFLDEGQKGTDLLTLIRKEQPEAGVAMMSSLDLQRFLEAIAGERDLQILPKPFSVAQLKAFLFDVLSHVGSNSIRLVQSI